MNSTIQRYRNYTVITYIKSYRNPGFSTMRANDNETAAKLLCPPLIGSIEEESTVAANWEGIFGPLAGRKVVISFCFQNLLFYRNVSV